MPNLCSITVEVSYTELISAITSFVMVVISVIGVIGLFNLRKQQKEACYGFYLNVATHLEIIKSYLTLSNEMASWLRILGMDYASRKKSDNKSIYETALKVAEYSSNFLQFLETATNQVPPFCGKKEKQEWNNSFSILRKNLIEFSLWNKLNNVYNEWGPDNCEKSYKELKNAIDCILKNIKKKIDS